MPNLCTALVLMKSRLVGWYIAVTRNTNQMYVWQQGKSTYMMINGMEFWGSPALSCGFLTVADFSFSQITFYFFRDSDIRVAAGIVPTEQTVPVYSCKLILFPIWLCVFILAMSIVSCPLHLYYPLFLLQRPTLFLPPPSPPPSDFPLPLRWVVSFNFMPPALAVAPLASARLALWHAASSGATSLSYAHRHTRTMPQICMLSAPGYASASMQNLWQKFWHKDTMLSETWLHKQVQWHGSSTRTNGFSFSVDANLNATLFPHICIILLD